MAADDYEILLVLSVTKHIVAQYKHTWSFESFKDKGKWKSRILLNCFVNVPGSQLDIEIVFQDSSSRLLNSIMAIWKPCI